MLAYEKIGLGLGIHTVSITNLDNYSINLDAIDIDGKLLPYNKAISLNKSSIDLNVNDSQ